MYTFADGDAAAGGAGNTDARPAVDQLRRQFGAGFIQHGETGPVFGQIGQAGPNIGKRVDQHGGIVFFAEQSGTGAEDLFLGGQEDLDMLLFRPFVDQTDGGTRDDVMASYYSLLLVRKETNAGACAAVHRELAQVPA